MFRLIFLLLLLSTQAHATLVGRFQLDHPALGTAGGSSLHTQIETIYTRLSDSLNSRYFTHSAVANSTTVSDSHNFGMSLSELSVRIYTGTHPNLTRVSDPTAAGWIIAATVGSTKTSIDVTTPSSGGPHTFVVVVTQGSGVEKLDDLSDVDLTTPPEDGQALVYSSTSTQWLPGASGDSSFKCQAVSTPNLTLKSGYIITKGGTEYQLASDTSINLTTVLGTSPSNATAYYLYIDTNAVPSATTLGNGRKVRVVSTASHFALSTTTPDSIYLPRYIPLCVIKSATTGNAWSGTGSAFATLATRRHNEGQTMYGTGEINVIGNPYDAINWAAGANMTVATTTTTSELPLGTSASGALFQTVPSGIKITRASGTNSAYYRFTMPTALKNRKLKIQWEQHPISGYAAGDLKVQMRNNSASDYSGSYTAFSLSTDVSGVSGIPSTDGRFITYFDSDSSDYYELDITGVSGTTALVITNVIVGPGFMPQGAAISEAQSWTPTGSWVSNTTYTGKYWRRGSRGLFNAKLALTGAPTNTALTINMPTGLTIDSSAVNTTLWASNLGMGGTNQAYNFEVLSNGSTSSVQVVYQNATSGTIGTFTSTAPLTWANGHTIDIWFEVPVAEWAGSGTINIAQNDVEYVWNSGSSTTVNDTTSFGYGPAGTAFVAFSTSGTSAIVRRVRFQSPIADGDVITLQYLFSSATKWVDAAQLIPFSSNDAGTTYYGGSLRCDLPGGAGTAATDCDVAFFSARAPGLSWDTSAKWRVVKQKGGQAIGFGLATSSLSGLVSTTTQTFGGRKNGGNSKVSVYLGTNATATNGASTRIPFDTETFDTNAEHDSTSTKGRFTPTNAGYYFITSAFVVNSVSTISNIDCEIYKTGTRVAHATAWGLAGGNANCEISGIFFLNGSTDYLEVHVTNSDGTNRTIDSNSGDLGRTYMHITELF